VRGKGRIANLEILELESLTFYERLRVMGRDRVEGKRKGLRIYGFISFVSFGPIVFGGCEGEGPMEERCRGFA
jgi:hypothetical protein